MPRGRGQYAKYCFKIRNETKAKAVILIIIDGNDGDGMEVHGEVDVFGLPAYFRELANEMELDLKKGVV